MKQVKKTPLPKALVKTPRLKGLILAGGHGTRLRPLTHTGPKQLIPIANKANILYCLEDLRDVGVKDIGIILGDNMPEKVKELLGDGKKYGVRIKYIVQGAPKGIAHAVYCAKKFMGNDPFIVYLGDNLIAGGINDLVRKFQDQNADGAVALCKVKDPSRYGVAELDKSGRIIGSVEKPKVPKTDLAIIGIYIFTKSVFGIIRKQKPSWRNELEITDSIQAMITKGFNIQSYIVTGFWKDTGKPEDILDANHMVLDAIVAKNDGTIEPGAEVQGRVVIGKGSVIKEGCLVKGPTIIGKDCVIGPHTYIGPYTAVGDGCKVIGGELEASILIGGVEISCGKKIVNSLVGANCIIAKSEGHKPEGIRLVIGENSNIKI
jgi:glucose-1-phosphate thymidylyltransferase